MSKCPSSPKYRKAIPEGIKLRLWVQSGGRCAICNEILYRNGLTLKFDNFADFAHIISYSEKGTRGGEKSEKLQIEYDNLILLCKRDHKEVDGDENLWTVERLKNKKDNHEKRIELLTGINKNLKTHALAIQSNIGDRSVKIDYTEVNLAIIANKMYPSQEKPFLIGISGDFGSGDIDFYTYNARRITKGIESFLEPMNTLNEKVHLSIFPFAIIPLLVHFGKQLGDKYPIQLFQHHRSPAAGWEWMEDTSNIDYILKRPLKRSHSPEVFLLIALSDNINQDKYRSLTKDNTNIYEITIPTPTPNFLTDKNLITKFHTIYRLVLNEIQNDFGKECIINLLLAVPCPIAVQCGLSLLERKDPEIIVYDYDKKMGGFIKALKIN